MSELVDRVAKIIQDSCPREGMHPQVASHMARAVIDDAELLEIAEKQVLAMLESGKTEGGLLEEAIATLKRELPGWWWKVGSCCVSDDACIAPDFNDPVHGERLKAELFPIVPGSELDAGFDVDQRPPGNPAGALLQALADAKAYLKARGVMKCKHLTISDEAYRNDKPAPVFLCAWPMNKLKVAPSWVHRQIGGGIMIDHKLECPGCSCFERQEASNELP